MEFKPVRNSVQSFAQDMERVLRKNDHKDGWEDMTYKEMLVRLDEEVNELKIAISNNESSTVILDEAIDVGNFAMFIAAHAYRIGGN